MARLDHLGIGERAVEVRADFRDVAAGAVRARAGERPRLHRQAVGQRVAEPGVIA